MKAIFITVLLFASSGWSSSAELHVGSVQPEQFKFQIKENPMEVAVTKGNKSHTIKMSHTVSDASKINIQITGADGKVISQELLFVVLASGAAYQDIQIYAPIRSADVVLSSKIEPICTIRNHGDFYWDSADELGKKLRLVEKNKTASLEILVRGTETQKTAEFTASGCSFRLLKNYKQLFCILREKA